jgi:hypothetical protein
MQMHLSTHTVTQVHAQMCDYAHTQMHTEEKPHAHIFLLTSGPPQGDTNSSFPSKGASQLLVIVSASFAWESLYPSPNSLQKSLVRILLVPLTKDCGQPTHASL